MTQEGGGREGGRNVSEPHITVALAVRNGKWRS